jgi:hypothetical protein
MLLSACRETAGNGVTNDHLYIGTYVGKKEHDNGTRTFELFTIFAKYFLGEKISAFSFQCFYLLS